MKVKFKKLTNTAVLPSKGTLGSAAYDLVVDETIKIPRGRSVIPLNFAIGMPLGIEAKIEPRSGNSAKGMLGVYSLTEPIFTRFDCDVIVGKIDSDYTGGIGVIVNNRDLPFHITKDTAVAQMTFYKVEEADFYQVEHLDETDRGEGGFGSTDKHKGL